MRSASSLACSISWSALVDAISSRRAAAAEASPMVGPGTDGAMGCATGVGASNSGSGSGSSCGGSCSTTGMVGAGRCAVTAGMMPVGSPDDAAATLARNSSFSTVSRSNSASTSSRNWSTSPMSYPSRSRTGVKRLLRTSSGVNGMTALLALIDYERPPYSVAFTSATSVRGVGGTPTSDHGEDDDLLKDVDADKQHHGRKIEHRAAHTDRRDDRADGSKWRIGDGVDGFAEGSNEA